MTQTKSFVTIVVVGDPVLVPVQAEGFVSHEINNALVGFRKLGFKVLLVICDIQIAFNLNSETDVQDGWGVGRGGILGTILESHAAVKCPLTPESVVGLFLYTQTLPQTQERAQKMVHLRPLYFCPF